MNLPLECMKKGHPSYGGGRPRTSIPEKEELIELGKDLVAWAEVQAKKNDPIRVRFCDWYTDRGFVRKQWENFRDLPEFEWYYEKARSLMGLRYIDGTVNQSIAHRYLRIYDPEMRDAEDQDADNNELRKAAAAQRETRANAEATAAVLDEIQKNKRELK